MAIAFLAVLAIGYAALVWYSVWWLLVIPAFGLILLEGEISAKRRRAKLMAERQNESICTFARSFDARNTDTWVIRAVYEDLQEYVGHDELVPIRADDHLEKDLGIDDEDLDIDLVVSIAHRCKRSLDDTKSNPMYDKVVTVRDLVEFFNFQPLVCQS